MLRLRTLGIAALVLGISVVAAQADVVYSLEVVPNTLPGYTTYDVMVSAAGEEAAGGWDWLGAVWDISLSSGEIFVDPVATPIFSGGDPIGVYKPPVSSTLFAAYPNWEWTTYAGRPPMILGLPSAPSFVVNDFAADPANGTLHMAVYDDLLQPNLPFRGLRLTVTDGADGTITVDTGIDPTPDGSVTADIKQSGEVEILLGDPPTFVAQDVIDGVYPAGVGEEDWNDNPANDPMDRKGWNNPEREIVLNLASTGVTGHSWDFGGGLVKTGEEITVTVGELLAAGWENLPGPPAGSGFIGVVSVTLTKDGTPDTGDLNVFLPEPGTMALLVVGFLGTVLRRRRK